jgi:hypothetical protein
MNRDMGFIIVVVIAAFFAGLFLMAPAGMGVASSWAAAVLIVFVAVAIVILALS